MPFLRSAMSFQMKWNRFFKRFYFLMFFGGKQLLAGLACRWCIIGITQCFHLFSCYNIITFSSEGLYFELPTATFSLDFFQFGRKRHTMGTRVAFHCYEAFHQNIKLRPHLEKPLSRHLCIFNWAIY